MPDRRPCSLVAAFLYGLLAPGVGAAAVIRLLSVARVPGGDGSFFAVWGPLLVLSSGALAACVRSPAIRFVPAAALGVLTPVVLVPAVLGGGDHIWLMLHVFGLLPVAFGAVCAQFLLGPMSRSPAHR